MVISTGLTASLSHSCGPRLGYIHLVLEFAVVEAPEVDALDDLRVAHVWSSCVNICVHLSIERTVGCGQFRARSCICNYILVACPWKSQEDTITAENVARSTLPLRQEALMLRLDNMDCEARPCLGWFWIERVLFVYMLRH